MSKKISRTFSKLVATAAAILMAAGLSGCVSTAAHPDDAVGSYVQAVKEKRADDVYDMLGEELRGEMSKEDFRAFFKDNHAEILAQAEEISRVLDAKGMEIDAALPVKEGTELAFSYEDDGWKLADDTPAIAGASSPRATIDALSAAVEKRDLASILLLLSKEKSDTLAAELEILRAGLSNISDEDIVIRGNTATIHLDWNLKLELVNEDGAWRLQRLAQ